MDESSKVNLRTKHPFNLATLYTFILALAFMGFLLSNLIPLNPGTWRNTLIISLVIVILDLLSPEVSVAIITLTSSILLAVATNLGIFPTECALLFALPVLLIRYRKRNIFAVVANVSISGVGSGVAYTAYIEMGGVTGHYQHHFLALVTFIVVYCIVNFLASMTGLYLFQRTQLSLLEILRITDFHLIVSYVVEMVLGVLAGILYQSYGMLGLILISGVLLLVTRIFAKYYQTRQDAETDSLTGLLNRRAFQKKLHHQIKKRRTLSLLVLDLDRFKHINDTFGHRQGDEILVETATFLQSQVGKCGMIARYGGEEFCIMLFDPNQVQNFAEELRVSLANHRFHVNSNLTLTASIGIATYPESGTNWETLFESADKALYEAKSLRNTVRMHSPRSMKESLSQPSIAGPNSLA